MECLTRNKRMESSLIVGKKSQIKNMTESTIGTAKSLFSEC